MKNFTKLTLLSLLSLLSIGTFPLYSKPLTPNEALQRVESVATGRRFSPISGELILNYTLRDKDSEPSLYIFNRFGSSGFVVLSADDAAFPVLGYSYDSCFDPDNIPPQLDYWLKEYSLQIESARNSDFTAAGSSSDLPFSGMEEIAPLLKSKWNQGAPYNDYCYEISSDGTQTKSVTGCVATSMAQIMYYFKLPATGHGEISYKHGDSGTYTMNFGDQAFNWDKMLPTYYPGSYNEEEADAVAYLMKACGYSVKMDYGKGESGANGTAIAGALITYFGYNPNIQVQTRAFYTYDDWAEMIYDNLQNVGPVVYNGSALDGGHSFVCDGYDGNGYFHINWGWGGMSDGYYLLDALNPDEFGIGGAAGGYNLGQQVILNITPDTTEAREIQLMQFGNAKGKIADGKLSLELDDASVPGFQYINPSPVKLTFGLKVENVSDSDQAVQYFESAKKDLDAIQGSRFTWEVDGTDIDLSKVEMNEGEEYRFIFATNISSGSATAWSETVPEPGKSNYVTVVKTANGYTLTNNTVGDITVSDFEIVSSPVYFNMPVKFSASFSNSSEEQLTRNYSAVFFDSSGTECYKMENYSINVEGETTVTNDWTSINWYKENGAGDVTEATQYTVKLYDNWQGNYVDGIEQTVTVLPEKSEGKVESELSIVNGKKEGNVYVIEGNELSVSLTVKVTEGSFNHTIMLAIQAPESSGSYYTIMHKHFDAIPDLSAGEQQVFDMSVVFEDAEPGKTYRVEVWGEGSGFNETELVKFSLSADGIDRIAPDTSGIYTIYNLDGTLRNKTVTFDSIKDLPAGIYIVNGKKIVK